ncbi:MAG: HAD hydrolase family protein [Bacteroidales bacterium]|jgi:hydroxymethylpyrimidine pyrophosphatase-like HAD family hydrolase|nr:HAD hydrolase family protein [Bacteroidales bacterium]
MKPDFLVILDFDGTSNDICPTDLRLHPAVLQVLRDCIDNGWGWVLNSDRCFTDLQFIVKQLSKELRPVAVVASRRTIALKNNKGTYCLHVKWNRENELLHLQLWQRLQPYLQNIYAEIYSDFEVFLDLCDRAVLGFVVHTDDVKRLSARLRNLVARIDIASVSSNHESVFIVHSDFCKGGASREVAKVLGVTINQMGAVGDGANDLPMLHSDTVCYAGCPSNACDEVRKYVAGRKGMVASLYGGVEQLQYCEIGVTLLQGKVINK